MYKKKDVMTKTSFENQVHDNIACEAIDPRV
jgi:hypothetical protein